MQRAIRDAVAGVSCVLFVVEAGRFGPDDEAVLQLLPSDVPVILVINKVDGGADKRGAAAVHPGALRTSIRGRRSCRCRRRPACRSTTCNARSRSWLPVAPPLFDADDLTDRSERFLVSELIREKVFRQLGDELPYGMTVVIDRFVEEPSRQEGGRFCRIAATIIVERASHKAMLIGAGGGTTEVDRHRGARRHRAVAAGAGCISSSGSRSRSGWADSAALVRSFGYE